jgi:hypothetical protein
MTAVRSMRNAVILSTLLYISSFYLLKLILPFAVALWVSFMGFFMFRALFQWLMFRRRGWDLD